EEMGLSTGVVGILKGNGLNTSRPVVDAFDSDLGRRPGCGRVTVQTVATWINSHRCQRRSETRAASVLTPLDRGWPGGLRLRGMIARRARRSLKEDLELVTYTVTSHKGTHEIEDLAKPGGPYLSLGETVDLETMVQTFVDRNQQVRARLRILRR